MKMRVNISCLYGCLIAMLFSAAVSLTAQTFQCRNNELYLVTTNTTQSLLYRISYETPDGPYRFEEIPLSDPSTRISCIGLSVYDLYMYGLDLDTYELLRIDQTGKITKLGVPSNLNTSEYEYWAGEVTPDGRRFRVIGRNKETQRDEISYTINLLSIDYLAGPATLLSDLPVNIMDIASDPGLGVTYGFSADNQRLVVLSTNIISTHLYGGISERMGSLFFDETGQLLAYGGKGGDSSQTGFYLFDKVNGQAERKTEGPSARFSDGCSCPYYVDFFKRIEPNVVTPCSEFIIEYQIVNQSGMGRLGGVFVDSLPEGFIITEILENSALLSTIVSGEGSNVLKIENLDMKLSGTVIRIKVRTPAILGTFPTQASIQNLPLGLGKPVYSDEITTSVPDDPSIIKVISSQQLELEDYIRFSCNGDTAILSLPVTANTYLWSDGSTQPELRTTENGLYWVEAVSDCFVFNDSILIPNRPPAPELDLGPDRQLKQGQSTTLNYLNTANDVIAYAWEYAGNSDLSCTNCPNPVLTAIQNDTISLTLITADGCVLTDAFILEVESVRDVFIPNAFSPNGDGLNDAFFVQGASGILVKEMMVFNRWGKKVFSASELPVNDQGLGWNGRIGSELVESGVYVYYIRVQYPDQRQEVFTGDVLIVR